MKNKNHFSIQIQCLDSKLCYITALHKTTLERDQAIEDVKQSAKVLKERVFGNKKASIKIIDELTGKQIK